jgi:hypothetical protein
LALLTQHQFLLAAESDRYGLVYRVMFFVPIGSVLWNHMTLVSRDHIPLVGLECQDAHVGHVVIPLSCDGVIPVLRRARSRESRAEWLPLPEPEVKWRATSTSGLTDRSTKVSGVPAAESEVPRTLIGTE